MFGWLKIKIRDHFYLFNFQSLTNKRGFKILFEQMDNKLSQFFFSFIMVTETKIREHFYISTF